MQSRRRILLADKIYKCKVDYLISNGTQYIDTGFIPDNNTRVIMDVKVNKTGTFPYFGARKNQNTPKLTYGMWMMDTTTIRSDYDEDQKEKGASNLTSRTIIDKNKNILTAYGTTVTNSTGTFETNCSLAILGFNTSGEIDGRRLSANLYRFKIYDNDNLIFDGFPALDWDDIPCLWDRCHNKLYYSDGASQFGYSKGGVEKDPPEPPISKTIVLQNQKANTTFQKTTSLTSKLGSKFSIFINYTNNNSSSSTASYMPKSGNYILRICFGSVETFPESASFLGSTNYGLFLRNNGDNELGICTIIEGFGFFTTCFESASVNDYTGNHKVLLTLQLGSSNSSDITFKFFVDGKKGTSDAALESSACVGKVIIGNKYSRENGEIIEGEEGFIPGGAIGGIIGGGSTGGGSTSSTGPYSLNNNVIYHEISLITSELTDAEAKELTTL